MQEENIKLEQMALKCIQIGIRVLLNVLECHYSSKRSQPMVIE